MQIKAGTRIIFEMADDTTLTWTATEDTDTSHLREVIDRFETIWTE